MCRWLDLPGGRPTHFSAGSLNSVASYVALQSFWLGGSLLQTVVWLAVLLIARLVVRRSSIAWGVLALLMVGFGYLSIGVVRTQAMDPSVRLAAAAVFWLLFVWVLWKHGALALTVAFFVEFLVEQAPWTLDASRWYFWRGPFVAAIIAALALWGFRNTLGRQSAFPTGALD